VDTANPNILVGVTGDHEIDAALDYAAAIRRGCGLHPCTCGIPATSVGRRPSS
jgi:hypothetical protein